MLDKFKKLLSGQPTTDESEQVVEAVEQVTETLTLTVDTSAVQAELDSMKAQLESVSADFGTKLAEAEGKIAEMTALLEAAQAELAAVAAEKAVMVANALTVKLAARKEKIVASIGTEKADALMAATEGLDDAAFEAVVSAMAGSVEAEANTDLFKEVGVTAEADAAKVIEKSEEMKLLESKYGAK